MTLTIMAELEQDSEAWHTARRGLVTASSVGKLLTLEPPSAVTVDCPKCKASAGSSCISLARKEPTPVKTYHPERCAVTAEMPPEIAVANNDTSRGLTSLLVAERITGVTEPTFMSDDMFRGHEIEPIARDTYSGHYEQAVETGFCRRDEDGWSLGFSPDGLVGFDGLLEVKAPRQRGHLNTILSGEVPAHHLAQLQAGLLVTGRRWIDFCSYHAGMPMFVKRVHPDPAWHAAIVAAVTKFEKTAAEMVAAYEQATKDMPATERIDLDRVELKLA